MNSDFTAPLVLWVSMNKGAVDGKHMALHDGLWGLENEGSQYAAMQRYHRHQDNISPQGPEKKKVFMWFPFHKCRLHCLENIPWQLEFTTRLAQGSALPALDDQRQGLSVHFHASLQDWSLTIRNSMTENVCLDLENTLPKLTGVVTWKLKMQETLQLLTRQSGWHRIKDSRLSAVAHRHQLHWLKCPSLLSCAQYQLQQQDWDCLCDTNNLQQLKRKIPLKPD